MTATRVLFFAEPATAAHVGRPVVLAQGLAREGYEVSVATGRDFRHIAEDAGLPVHDLWSIGTRAYLSAVAAGRPVFPYEVLEQYASDDARLIAQVRPDVIVGDFRLSLAVSARLARIPYLAISNAYWSPYAAGRFTIPPHRATRLFGVGMANRVFQLLRPMIFAHHARPMQQLRRRHGLQPIAYGLRGVFTESDMTLFADVPEMVPSADCGSPNRYAYLGPVVWDPGGELPIDILTGSDQRPLAYISLGSSGDPELLGTIMKAAEASGCRVAAATGKLAYSLPTGIHAIVRPSFPGGELAAMAAVVICNGGSPSAHQALAQGTPVIGIPGNLDQLLNMQFVVATGAGLAIRADQVTIPRLEATIRRILDQQQFKQRAMRVKHWLSTYAAVPRLEGSMRQTLANL